ncbi:MAG TPA: sodium-translocating pyrophosphatase [Chroococcales cyanobacterium]
MDVRLMEEIALWVAPLTAIAALLYGVFLSLSILKADQGTPKMQQIAKLVRDGSNAYLSRQFKTISWLVVILTVLIFFSVRGHSVSFGAPDKISMGTAAAFVLGAVFSALAGFIGMYLAVRGNVRTAAASTKDLNSALKIAFGSGTVSGMFVVGLGLLGISMIYIVFREQATQVLVGFGFGACLLAMFMRVGGGIFTKAADVGADLVGKVEKGIPEDDPRNPATIADNVGDNVGDCAGMGADIFESYAVTIVAAMILGHSLFGIKGVIFPLLARSAGVLTSILGTFFVKAKPGDSSPMVAIKRGFLFAAGLAAVFFVLFSYLFLQGIATPWYNFAICALTGLASTVVIALITEYYTDTRYTPVKSIAASSTTGAGTTIITGLSIGMESAFVTAMVVCVTVAVGYALGNFYGIALAGMGMLATTGIIVSMDSFGPIADNANGIGEMAGLDEKARQIMADLDAVGNTTKALTKGFAISSAAVAAIALFATYGNAIQETLGRIDPITGLHIPYVINIAMPEVFIGLLIGAALPWLFSAQLIAAVGRAAHAMVEEVRRQFREIPGIMDYTAEPDSATCVDISTQAAIHELIFPASMIILAPVVVGFLLGDAALGAFLGGLIVSAQLLAVFSCNSGGAWDNGKKFVEDGFFGGKGSETHKAAVVGDTVGDPLKDTSGPALNPMIKVANIVALMAAPAVATVHVESYWKILIFTAAFLALAWRFVQTSALEKARFDKEVAAPVPAKEGVSV